MGCIHLHADQLLVVVQCRQRVGTHGGHEYRLELLTGFHCGLVHHAISLSELAIRPAPRQAGSGRLPLLPTKLAALFVQRNMIFKHAALAMLSRTQRPEKAVSLTVSKQMLTGFSIHCDTRLWIHTLH